MEKNITLALLHKEKWLKYLINHQTEFESVQKYFASGMAKKKLSLTYMDICGSSNHLKSSDDLKFIVMKFPDGHQLEIFTADSVLVTCATQDCTTQFRRESEKKLLCTSCMKLTRARKRKVIF